MKFGADGPPGRLWRAGGCGIIRRKFLGPREYRERCLHRSAIRQAAGGPMTSIGPYMGDVA